MNLKVKFVKELVFWTGVFKEGDICVLTKEDAEYFNDYIEVIEESDERAVRL